MYDKTVEELNKVLKGEHMAIDAYTRFIDDCTDAKIKDEFRAILRDHEKHAQEISDHIRSIGGIPEANTGFAGFMASAKLAMQSLGGNDLDILKRAYDGEDKGVAAAEEIAKENFDSGSKDLILGILSEDHDHLRSMAKLIGTIENNEQ